MNTIYHLNNIYTYESTSSIIVDLFLVYFFGAKVTILFKNSKKLYYLLHSYMKQIIHLMTQYHGFNLIKSCFKFELFAVISFRNILLLFIYTERERVS